MNLILVLTQTLDPILTLILTLVLIGPEPQSSCFRGAPFATLLFFLIDMSFGRHPFAVLVTLLSKLRGLCEGGTDSFTRKLYHSSPLLHAYTIKITRVFDWGRNELSLERPITFPSATRVRCPRVDSVTSGRVLGVNRYTGGAEVARQPPMPVRMPRGPVGVDSPLQVLTPLGRLMGIVR